MAGAHSQMCGVAETLLCGVAETLLARAGVRQARAGGGTTPLFLRSFNPAWAVVRDFRLLAALAGVLCDVRGHITLFSGGAFSGDALPVGEALGFALGGIAGEVSALIRALIGVVL